MSWNHRIFHTTHQVDDCVVEDYSIRETYYDKDGGIEFIQAEPLTLNEENIEDLADTIARLRQALNRPTLTPRDVPGYHYGEYEVRTHG